MNGGTGQRSRPQSSCNWLEARTTTFIQSVVTSRFTRVPSHLALWPGLYIVSAVVYVANLAPPAGDGATTAVHEHAKWWWCLLFTFLTGVGTYLLDRVKLRDAWLDPADEHAHPSRYAFIAKHSSAVRVGALACLLGATTIAWFQASQRWLLAIPLASALGVVAYAAKPRRIRPRLKDLLVLKNAYVAGGIAAFAGVVVWCWFHAGVSALASAWPSFAFAGLTLIVRVFADAVLCDLDDEAADRRFGTQTFPTTLGYRSAWNGAMALRLCVALALVLTPIGDRRMRLAWAIATAASSLALRVFRPARVRDWVDARFAIEGLAVMLALG